MIRNVLLVCTGNTCRSSMAQALLSKMLSDDLGGKAAHIQVVSAGTRAVLGMKATKNAIKVMADEGLSIENHQAKLITEEMIVAADLILTMTLEQKKIVTELVPRAERKTFTLTEFAEEMKEIDTLILEAERVRLAMEEKRRRIIQQESPKLEELRMRNLELSRQMRALDEELSRFEHRLEQELAPERQKLEKIQNKLTSIEISDPYGQNIEAYRFCAGEIKDKLASVVRRIKLSLEK